MFDPPPDTYRRPDPAFVALADVPVGAQLAARLAGLDLAGRTIEELGYALGAWGRLSSWAAGEMAALTATLGARVGCGTLTNDDYFICPEQEEVAFALRISPTSAGNRLEMAHVLTTRMPATLAALRAG
ncbi:MAG: hypothetical protein ACYDAQ_18565, partial [Mycobacteriales bacterium]